MNKYKNIVALVLMGVGYSTVTKAIPSTEFNIGNNHCPSNSREISDTKGFIDSLSLAQKKYYKEVLGIDLGGDGWEDHDLDEFENRLKSLASTYPTLRIGVL